MLVKMILHALLVLNLACVNSLIGHMKTDVRAPNFIDFLGGSNPSKDRPSCPHLFKNESKSNYSDIWSNVQKWLDIQNNKTQFIEDWINFKLQELEASDSDSSLILTQAILQNGCDNFLKKRRYFLKLKPNRKNDFGIAYSILVYKGPIQIEQILRAIYRPQNFYCFHIDLKSSSDFVSALSLLSSCFPAKNVFLSTRRENITYAGFSRLQADLNCMQDLLEKDPKKSWRYLINIAGQEFPLQTNEKLVQILSKYGNANDIRGEPLLSDAIQNRVLYEWKEISVNGSLRLRRTEIKKPNPPFPMRFTDLRKASAYGVFTRKFVNYTIHDEFAKKFLEWNRDTYSPDEHFWQSLNFNSKRLNIPSENYIDARNRLHIRAVRWAYYGGCHGKKVRNICIFGIKDLPYLYQARQSRLFANKFYIEYEPLALDCLDELLRNETIAYDKWELN